MTVASPTGEASRLLDQLRDAGVVVEAAIDLDGPDDVLTDAMLARIRENKAAVLALLVDHHDTAGTTTPEHHRDQPPAPPTIPGGEHLADCPPEVKATVDAIYEAFADIGGVEILNVRPAATTREAPHAGNPYRGRCVENPQRQPVVDLLANLHDAGHHDRAKDLADEWKERIAICTIDGKLPKSEAEAVALADLQAMAGNVREVAA